MSTEERDAVGLLLEELRQGRHQAFDELFRLVYDEMTELAHRHRRQWRGNETLDTRALVHETYLKLAPTGSVSWENEAHFLAAASRAIRHILISYARRRGAKKRGGAWRQVSLNEERFGAPTLTSSAWEERVVAVDDALARLATKSERQSRIVECRFFGGMTIEQTAAALGLSTATVTRAWAVARAWLHRELTGGPAGSRAQ